MCTPCILRHFPRHHPPPLAMMLSNSSQIVCLHAKHLCIQVYAKQNNKSMSLRCFFFFHALLSYIFFCCFHFRPFFIFVVVISFSQPHSSVWRNVLEHNEIHFVLCELQQCVMKATIEIRIAVGLSNTTNQLHMHTTWVGDRSSRIYNTPTGHNGHPNLTRYKICNHCCLLLSTNKKLRFCSSARFMMLKMSSAEETNNKICQLRRDNHLLSVSRAVYAERYSFDFSSPPTALSYGHHLSQAIAHSIQFNVNCTANY